MMRMKIIPPDLFISLAISLQTTRPCQRMIIVVPDVNIDLIMIIMTEMNGLIEAVITIAQKKEVKEAATTFNNTTKISVMTNTTK
ncbi:MAG: hypothetical protein Q4C95_10865 [Planctomycetia bacterium]|nr:hypothetical protein [Planctomycetia bacterium]